MKTVITIISFFLGWLCFWGFSLPSLLAQPLSSNCFEIESILVDACDNPEGENEMVYLRIGPNAINVNDFEIKWPNAGNPWLNFCQNPTTDNKIAAINATINCPTGKLIAPSGGVLPAGAKVLIITSENYKVGSHSFANLCDTLYVVFQCAGNTGGHFANYTATNPENPRTLEIKQKSTNCKDIVSYKPENLTTKSGNGDGDAAFFEPDGTVSYRNVGCKIPIIPICEIALDSANLKTFCTGQSAKIFFTGKNVPQYKYTWKATDKSDFPFVTPFFVIWNTPGTKTVTLHIDKNPYSPTPEACSVTVDIKPTPEANFSLGANVACVDGAISVTPQTAANPPSSNYIWQLGGGIANPSPPSDSPFSVSWNSAGTKTLRLRAYAGQCSSAFFSQTVTVSPRPIASFDIFEKTTCVGETLKVRAKEAGVANATYNWFLEKDGAPISLNWSGRGLHTIKLDQPGAYTLRFEAEAVCKETSIIQSWVVDPPPSFNWVFSNNNQPICAGANLIVTVSALSPSAAQLIWGATDGINPQPISGGAFSFSWSSPGMKTLTLRASANGCTSAVASQVIEVLPLPLANFSSIELPKCAGQNLKVTANNAGIAGSTYAWQVKKDGAVIPLTQTWTGAGPHTLNALTEGNYELALEVTTPAGCKTKSTPQNWTISPIPQFTLELPSTPVAACAGQALTMTIKDLSPPNAQLLWQATDNVQPFSVGPNIFQATWSTVGVKTLTLRAVANACTSVVITTEVQVTATPVAEITELLQPPVCTGNLLNMKAASTVDQSVYYWELIRDGIPIPLNSQWNGPGVYPYVLEEPGNYQLKLRVVSPSGCSSNVAQKIWQVNRTPSFRLTPETATTCSGQSFKFKVIDFNPPTATKNWSISEGPVPQPVNDTTFQISWNTPGVRTITLLAIQNGCSLQRNSIVTVYAYPSNNFSLPQGGTVCQNDNYTVTYPGIAQANWQWNWQITLPNGQTRNFNFIGPHPAPTDAPGIVSVTLTINNNGCALPAKTQTYLVKPKPQVTLNAPTQACTGASQNLSAQTDMPVSHYLWEATDFSFSFFNPQNSAVSVTWQNPGIKTIILRAVADGCTSAAAVKQVNVFRTPTAIFSPIPSAICQNANFRVEHSGIAGNGAQFNWRLTRQEPSPEEEIQTFTGRGQHTISNLNPGVYRLSLSVTENGCQAAPSEKIFTVHPNPNFDFEINKADYCQAEKIIITVPPAFQQSNLTYHWNLPVGFTPSSISGGGPHMLQTQNIGDFSISGYVLDDKGCTSAWASRALKIHRKPQAQITASRSVVCTEHPISVESLMQPSEFAYNWQITEILSAPATAGPLNLSWENIGVKTLRLIISSSYCADTAVRTIEAVAPPPPPPSVTVERCGPGAVSFSASGEGLLTVRLLSADGQNILGAKNAPPFILSWQAQTTTTLWLENFNPVAGCGSTRSEAIAKILPLPPILGFSVSQDNCVGDSITLSVNATLPGLRYFWQGPAGLLRETTEPYLKFVAVSTNQSGVYYLRVINSFNCTSSITQRQVTIHPLPLTPLVTYYHIFQENRPLCQGNEINLSVLNYPSYEEGTRFVWEGPAGFRHEPHPFPGVERAELHHTGWYWVRAVAKGCTSNAGKVWVTVYPKPLRPQLSNNSPICLGSDSLIRLQVLAPNDSLRYQWIGPDAFNREGKQITREAIASAMGVYKAVAISPQGCISDTGFTQVELIRALHDLRLVVRGDRCEGGAFTLEALPSVPGAIYHWETPLGESFSSQLNRFSRSELSTSDSGVYSVSYTVSGCTTPQASVLVNVLRRPQRPEVVGSTVNCRNQSLNLNIWNADSNTEYYWVSGNFNRQGGRLVLQYSQAAALENIRVYGVARGCTSVIQNIPISWIDRPEPPVILGERRVCLNDTLKLSVFSPVNGWNYIWKGPSDFSATGVAIERAATSPLLGGSYEVIASANGCSSLPQRVSVEIRNLPEPVTPITNAPICQGETLNLSVSPLNFLPLRWQGPNGFASTQTNPSINNASLEHSGLYFVSRFDGVCLSPKRSITVLIKPRPEPPTLYSNAPICQGETLRLTAIALPFEADIYWLFRNTSLAQGRQYVLPSVSLENKGIYEAYSVVDGCTSQKASIPIDIKPKPTQPIVLKSGQSFEFCEGARFRLEVRTQSDIEYYWSAPDGTPGYGPFIERSNASSLQNGRYDALAIQNGCTSEATSFFVTIKSTPSTPSLASVPSFCIDQGVTLSVNNPNRQAQYIWQGPLSYQSYRGIQINVHLSNLQEAGVFSVVQVIEGCTSLPATINLVPDLPPGPLLPFSNGPICQGQTLNLMAEAQGAELFLWQGPNNFTSQVRNPSLPNVTTAQAGEYYVWARRGACRSEIASVTVVIKPQPLPPRVGAVIANLCSGETIALNASSQQSGAMFYWTGPSNFESAASAPRIFQATTANSGFYTAIAILEGCSSLPATINITVRQKPAAPVLNSNSPLCEGQNLQLTASLIPGAQYQWTGPAGFSSMQQNPIISRASSANAGVYQVQVWAQGCTAVSETLQVQISPTPETPKISGNFPCVGGTLHLTPSIAPMPGLFYHWTGPNGFTSTSATPVIQLLGFENSGFYSLVVIQNGCSSGQATHFVDVQRCAKLAQPKDNYSQDLILYPNPAKNAVWVLGLGSDKEDAAWQYLIYNKEGKKIKQARFRLSEAIDLEGLSSGVYQIEFLQENFRKVLRLMISP
jgi:hypothetical protein